MKENQKFRLRFFSLCEMSDFSFFSQKKTLLTKVYFILSHMKKISSPESSFFYLVSQVKELNLKLFLHE